MRIRPLWPILFASLLAGCGSARLAESDLASIQEVQASLAQNHDEAARILLRFAANETLSKHILEAKLSLTQKAMAAGGAVPLGDILDDLDTLQAAEAKSQVIRDNTRDKIAFLSQQEERLKALTLSLSVFIQGQKNILQLLADQKASAPTPATQPATAP